MTLISLQNVAVSFGAVDVLRGVSVSINAGERIGLVGRNGAGKSTLFEVLSGDLKPSEGTRQVAGNISTATVHQLPADRAAEHTVYEAALSSLQDLIDLERGLEQASLDMSQGRPGAIEEYSSLHERFEAQEGYLYGVRLAQVLTGLGFAEADWSQPVAELSGGQRTRLELAKALLARPDLLLLDEPTNHIDIEAMEWLDAFLTRWPGTLVVISHDRYFLDRVTTRTWLLESGQVRSYRGNYASFEGLRRAEIELQQRQAEAQQEMIAREEAFIRRFRAGSRAREAKGRQKRLDRVVRLETPSSQRSARFRLGSQRSGELVLAAKDLAAGYGDEALVALGSLEVERGERIALLGANGSGKTTLLKTLAGQLPPVRGSRRLGANVKVAHYWQEAENLDPARTVIEELRWGRLMEPQAARGILGRFLFQGDDAYKLVGVLSGGERSRLALAKLVLEEANLLLLDEPTNHLDIPSREVLEGALADYEGTIVFVSHDRQLVSTLATQLWLLQDGRIAVFDGSYAEYLQSRQAAASTTQVRVAPPPVRADAAQQKRIAALESQIEAKERELDELGALIDVFSAQTDLAALQQHGERFEVLQRELEELMRAWEDGHSD